MGCHFCQLEKLASGKRQVSEARPHLAGRAGRSSKKWHKSANPGWTDIHASSKFKVSLKKPENNNNNNNNNTKLVDGTHSADLQVAGVLSRLRRIGYRL